MVSSLIETLLRTSVSRKRPSISVNVKLLIFANFYPITYKDKFFPKNILGGGAYSLIDYIFGALFFFFNLMCISTNVSIIMVKKNNVIRVS